MKNQKAMNNKIIYTHGGIFHADEVLGVAILQYLFTEVEGGEVPLVVRLERDKEAALNAALEDNAAYVLDIGREYSAENNNFDHHQNANISCAASLIWRHFGGAVCDGDAQLFAMIEQKLINFVDMWDRGQNALYKSVKALEDSLNSEVLLFSRIVSGFNRDPKNAYLQQQQFDKAVEFAVEVLGNTIYKCREEIAAKKLYEGGERHKTKSGKTYLLFNEYCRTWKDYKDSPEFAVMPAATAGQWQVLSIDSATHPLAADKSCSDLVFLHAAKFIAVFKTKEAAVNCAANQ